MSEKLWMENEDWNIWVNRSDLMYEGNGVYSAIVDFPGPASPIRHFFFSRISKDSTQSIKEIYIEGEFLQSVSYSEAKTPSGFKWVSLGQKTVGRGYRKIRIRADEHGIAGFDRIYITQNPRRVLNGEIESLIKEEKIFKPKSGVPLGGIGAGKLELCSDGRFRNITINGNIDTPIYQSESFFFAAHVKNSQGNVCRVISKDSVYNLEPVFSLEYEGVYPFARLKAKDNLLGIQLEITGFNPIIPYNSKDSSLPLALFKIRALNLLKEKISVDIAFSFENLLGCGGTSNPMELRKKRNEESGGMYTRWEEREGNMEAKFENENFSGVKFISGPKKEFCRQGEYALISGCPAANACSNYRQADGMEMWQRFSENGELPKINSKPSDGEPTAGVIVKRLELEAESVCEVRFALAWFIPDFWQAYKKEYGHYYTNHFNSAEEVAVYGLAKFEELESQAREVPDALIKSKLPGWFSKSLANDAYTLSTCTWFTKDGRFSVNESPSNMYGCMGTIDQKLYGNHYYTLFFPELDKTELLQFASAQGADGSMPHDIGCGWIDDKNSFSGWPDLTSAFVILSLKHYQLTGDKEYLDKVYPNLVKALLDYQIGLDSDDNGIANISGCGNTFDFEKFEGTSSYIATLWLAALKSLEELARRREDVSTVDRCRELFSKARTNAIAELWNGSYFRSYFDKKNNKGNENSHYSQVAGEFFAHLLGLGELYGESYVKSALQTTLRLNYHSQFTFPANEVTPDAELPNPNMFGWLPHARVFLAGLSFFEDFQQTGLDVMEKLENVLVKVNHDNQWDERLFYEPKTGKEHWGRFYMTAPASWLVYQAMLGYFWDRPLGILGITPNLPSSLLPFDGPMFLPGVWLQLQIEQNMNSISLHPWKILGKEEIKINELRLKPHEGKLRLLIDEKLVPCHRVESDYRQIERYQCEFCFNQVKSVKILWE